MQRVWQTLPFVTIVHEMAFRERGIYPNSLTFAGFILCILDFGNMRECRGIITITGWLHLHISGAKRDLCLFGPLTFQEKGVWGKLTKALLCILQLAALIDYKYQVMIIIHLHLHTLSQFISGNSGTSVYIPFRYLDSCSTIYYICD